MSDRLFLSFVAAVGVLIGAGITAESLPLPPSESVMVVGVAILIGIVIYSAMPHVNGGESV